MAAFRFRSRRTRRRWVFGVTTGVLAAALLFLIASAGATLSGSTFESGDGNLASNGAHDWDSPIQAINCASIPAANCGNDLVRSSADNSFGQGPKEDDPAPSVGTGSIPPNKDDLRRFYVNQEHQHSVGCAPGTGTPNDCDYLYLAWERTNLLGSAHMDFEFNQDSTVGANGVTPVRTANDLLIVFDFGGSGVPDLALLRWVTSGATSQCEASNSLPCWGNKVDLTAAGFAEGAVNGTALTDNRAPGNPFALPGDSSHSTFGEAGINLTGANVFPSNVCFHLGSAFLKSRSSGQSFTSTLKDFIAPIPVNITNCGKIIIRKVTSPSPDPTNTTFNYSTTGGSHTLSPSSFGLANGGSQDFGGTAFADTYTVTEADPSPTFAFQNIDCNVAAHPSDTSHGSTTSSSGRVLTIDLKPQDTVDCTYFNNLQLGAIAITKTSSKGGTGLAGADFTVTGPLPGGTAHQVTTGAGGTACVGNLAFGDYSVTETNAPTGYSIDPPATQTVTLSPPSGTCASGATPVAFSDTPLSKYDITFHSLAGAGVTSATVTCSDGTTATLGDGQSVSSGNLPPSPPDITCTINIDP